MREKTKKRPFGRRGAVMMEYVVVGVLVVAAAVAAVAVFGRSIVAMFDVSGRAAVGDSQTAGDALSDPSRGYRKQLESNRKEAQLYNDKFSDLPSTEKSGSR